MSATMNSRWRKFKVSDGLKRSKKVRNYTFLVKYSYQYFRIFPIFIYNERLPMKFYQFFQISQRFDKEKEKKH